MAAYSMVPVRGGWKDRYIIVNGNDARMALLLDSKRAGLCPAVFESEAAAESFLRHAAARIAAGKADGIRVDPADGKVVKADPGDFLPGDVVYLVRQSGN